MHSKLIQCVVGIAKPFFPSHFTPSHGQGMHASDHENIYIKHETLFNIFTKFNVTESVY